MREIERADWGSYLADVSAELPDAPVTMDVGQEDASIEADRMLLQTVTYDRRVDGIEIALAKAGPHFPDMVRHRISHPRRVCVDSPRGVLPSTITIDDEDGIRTRLRLGQTPAFAG